MAKNHSNPAGRIALFSLCIFLGNNIALHAQASLLDSLEFEYLVVDVFPDFNPTSPNELVGVQVRLADHGNGVYEDEFRFTSGARIALPPGEIKYIDDSTLYLEYLIDAQDWRFRMRLTKYSLVTGVPVPEAHYDLGVEELVTKTLGWPEPIFVVEDGFSEGGVCPVAVELVNSALKPITKFTHFLHDTCSILTNACWDGSRIIVLGQNGWDMRRFKAHVFEDSDFRSSTTITANIPGMEDDAYGLFYLDEHLLVSGFQRSDRSFYLYCFDKNGKLEWKIDPGKTLTDLYLLPNGKAVAYDQKNYTYTVDMRTGKIQPESQVPQFPGYHKFGKNSLITFWQNKVNVYRLFGRE
ncbi:MAG: hypothetical protein H6574_09495 [Lewinellaceae bacterium]|nr:hypothetical protein [Saprospiraceae bacterium]MCB9331303.1 hypothetical protein [Lewinellaceae bacterium]